MIIAIAFALQIFASPQGDLDRELTDVDFNFYLRELVDNELSSDSPMANLIYDYLVEATFDTTSESVFRSRIDALHRAQQENPDKIQRFLALDKRLARSFDKKMAESKTKRLLYAGAGAVVGALIAIPIGRAIQPGMKVLLIAVPAGALLGAGAGYLLGDLLAMPNYTYESGMVNNWDIAEMDEYLGRGK